MNKEETWSAFINEWERRLAEKGIIVGYSDCFGAGLLMEELCLANAAELKLKVGMKPSLAKMVEGWDGKRGESDNLADEVVKQRDGNNLQSVISNKYSDSDLTSSFPLDRLRRLNANEDPQLCDMKMIKYSEGLTAMFWNGSEWVCCRSNNTVGPFPNDLAYKTFGTFRPINFDG